MIEELQKKYSDVDACPVRNVVDRIGDKWSLLVLLVLEEGSVLRFNELHKSIGSISQKMLATTLKNLEADGLVNRVVFPEIPPRVEYNLTERGRSLLPHLHGLIDWANGHMGEIMQSRSAYPQVAK